MKYLNKNSIEELISKFKSSKKSLIALDYDGTLIPFDIKILKPDNELLNLLERLSKIKNAEILIITGRGKDKLESWFSRLNVSIIAEHGIWFKKFSRSWQKVLNVNNKLGKETPKLLDFLKEKFKWIWIEEKNYSIAVVITKNAKNLKTKVFNYVKVNIKNKDFAIIKSKKNIIEIRPKILNKGYAIKKWLKRYKYDFILSFGDDVDDEKMFKVLKEKKKTNSNVYTVKVGYGKSSADYFVENYKEVRNFLKNLCKEK